MNVNDIFPSRFVKAHDLGDKEVTVTIKGATMEDMGHGTEKETKLCLWFERATKGFVLNKTNAMIIASMYGPETDNWHGKAITIYSARVKAFGAWHDAVRVKEQIPARNVGAARIPEVLQEPPPLDDEEDLLDVDEGRADEDFYNRSQATQKPIAAYAGNNGQNDTSNATPPHNRMWGIGLSVLGADWELAHNWLIKQWSKNATPNNVRDSSKELSDDEKTMLGDWMNENAAIIQQTWTKQRPVEQAKRNGVAQAA